MFTHYRDTPLTFTREDLLPGVTVWVIEPHGRHRDAGGHLPRLPVRAGRDLGLLLDRVTTELDRLELVP